MTFVISYMPSDFEAEKLDMLQNTIVNLSYIESINASLHGLQHDLPNGEVYIFSGSTDKTGETFLSQRQDNYSITSAVIVIDFDPIDTLQYLSSIDGQWHDASLEAIVANEIGNVVSMMDTSSESYHRDIMNDDVVTASENYSGHYQDKVHQFFGEVERGGEVPEGAALTGVPDGKISHTLSEWLAAYIAHMEGGEVVGIPEFLSGGQINMSDVLTNNIGDGLIYSHFYDNCALLPTWFGQARTEFTDYIPRLRDTNNRCRDSIDCSYWEWIPSTV